MSRVSVECVHKEMEADREGTEEGQRGGGGGGEDEDGLKEYLDNRKSSGKIRADVYNVRTSSAHTATRASPTFLLKAPNLVFERARAQRAPNGKMWM